MGYFVTKCVAKNFQKSANLVTLLVNVFLRQKRLKFSDEWSAQEFSVTILGDFWYFLAKKIFITKVAQMFGDFLASCENHRF